MPTLHWINKDKTIKDSKNLPYKILRENKDLSYSAVNENSTAKQGVVKISPLLEGRMPEGQEGSLNNNLELRIKNEESKSTPPPLCGTSPQNREGLGMVWGTSPQSREGLNIQDNMIIKGDNLEVLKSLLPYYTGKVKCIYIDPPYNTGNAFEHYNDNLEHSIWLNMMYPRLQLMRELLREDGSIWVSMDDDEDHYCKVIMDEIFGRKNFINNVIWEKKFSPQNNSQWLSDNHDHILVYAKNKEVWRPNPLQRTEEMNSRYKNPDNDPRGVWTSGDLSVMSSGNNSYEITLPTGKKILPPKGRGWGVSKEKFEELVKDNRIWFGKDGNNIPRFKRFLSDVKDGTVSLTIWKREEVGDNQEAKREVKEFNSNEVFSTPKPEKLIEKILLLGSQPHDLILDCFLGSGTTTAVAHKMNRRYIGVEMGDHIMTHVVPRMKKVIDGTDQGGISKSVNWTGGGSYRYYELGDTIFDSNGKISKSVDFDTLASHIWFSETGTPLKGSIYPLIEGRCPQDRGDLLECKIKNEELRFDKIDNLSTPPVNSVDILPARQGGIVDGMGQLSAKQGGIESCPSLRGNVNEVDKGELNNNLESKSTPPPLRGTSPQSREGLGMVCGTSPQSREGLNIQNKTALLGIYNDVAYVLLYNGILKDKRPKDGNVLNYAVLSYIEELLSDKVYKNIVVYGDACKIKNDVLEEKNVVFKQIPYSVKGK